MAIFNFETRAPYWKSLQFVWFVDAGNVFKVRERHSPRRNAHDERRRIQVPIADWPVARRLGLEAEHALAGDRRPRALERPAHFAGAGILTRLMLCLWWVTGYHFQLPGFVRATRTEPDLNPSPVTRNFLIGRWQSWAASRSR
jgi:hypothetical protein